MNKTTFVYPKIHLFNPIPAISGTTISTVNNAHNGYVSCALIKFFLWLLRNFIFAHAIESCTLMIGMQTKRNTVKTDIINPSINPLMKKNIMM
jgi:hypothetical protein